MDLSKELQHRADNNVPTAATELTWEQIIDARQQLKPGTIEHVTLALYTYIPPRRQQDYWKLQLQLQLSPNSSSSSTTATTPTGHLDLSATPPTMTITAFKTDDKYPAYTVVLPPTLVQAIKAYLAAEETIAATAAMVANVRTNANTNAKASASKTVKAVKSVKTVKAVKTAREYLFCKRNGDPYATLSSFTDANNTVIKKALNNQHASVNSIRHAGASFVAMDPAMLYGERKAYALAMGHSLAMQGQYVVARSAQSRTGDGLRPLRSL
jgi:hypothetical protein